MFHEISRSIHEIHAQMSGSVITLQQAQSEINGQIEGRAFAVNAIDIDRYQLLALASIATSTSTSTSTSTRAS
jgi:hypothetical protein